MMANFIWDDFKRFWGILYLKTIFLLSHSKEGCISNKISCFIIWKSWPLMDGILCNTSSGQIAALTKTSQCNKCSLKEILQCVITMLTWHQLKWPNTKQSFKTSQDIIPFGFVGHLLILLVNTSCMLVDNVWWMKINWYRALHLTNKIQWHHFQLNNQH